MLKKGDVIVSSELPTRDRYVVITSFNERQSGCHNEPDWYAWTVHLRKIDENLVEQGDTIRRYQSRGFIDDVQLHLFDVVDHLREERKWVR